MTTAVADLTGRRAPLGLGVLALILAAALALLQLTGARQTLLFLVGAALGLTLYHAAFGFTSAWRVFVAERRGRGLRAQMFLLAFAVLLFFPAMSSGELFGQPVNGFVSPVGISVLAGAFIFGIGMQLGGGCASGTLFTVGGGNARMLVTLVFFCLGSLIATHHVDWWFALPSLAPVSVVQSLGLWPALLVNLAVFALIAWFTLVLEKRRHGSLEAEPASTRRGAERGLMLGYGARLAYGCNIGAYFSGIASGSLHGWVWLAAAFTGNILGVRLRGWFFPGERPKAALNGC
ncbi:hypothetical protein C7I36_15865 [Zobellella taiwanensis]|uniref:Sulphur transport domain-containing protein n=1 Tax=Zobellella taiwanensis TaxID=347535 RepID=A0A2P7QGU9_9GAMM|nr:YeeE/YedE family protein [Zobellella taiwanensis]PSJ37208.1 hypothetical protein C7I36_15865 [Zobellella taiwanensis]